MYKSHLKIHLIFVVKYRKSLIKTELKDFLYKEMIDICDGRKFKILSQGGEEDHMHFLIRYLPSISVSKIVERLKQISTVNLWRNFSEILRPHFWKEQTFWSDGYYVSSIGKISEEVVKKYIDSQYLA